MPACGSVRTQVLDLLYQILLIFMQMAQSPEDARTGVSSLKHQAPGPAVTASFLPLHYLWKWLPAPSREQVPVCPVTTCFLSLLPKASLPCFLRSACQQHAGGRSVCRGAVHTDHPACLALGSACSGGLEGARTCLFSPL